MGQGRLAISQGRVLGILTVSLAQNHMHTTLGTGLPRCEVDKTVASMAAFYGMTYLFTANVP